MLLLLLGFIVGTLLGAIGAGGAVLAVPLLIWMTGCTVVEAAPVALVGVAAGATVATILSWDVGRVRYRAAILMGLGSLLGAPVALWAGTWVSLAALEGLFALVLATVAIRLIAPNILPRAERVLCRLDPARNRIAWTRGTVAYVATTGVVAGGFSTLLGVGGGFVIVPSLKTFSDLPAHAVVATTLMAVALISSISVGAGALQGAHIAAELALPFTVGAVAGTALSRRLVVHIPHAVLERVLGFALLLASIGMAARALGLA